MNLDNPVLEPLEYFFPLIRSIAIKRYSNCARCTNDIDDFIAQMYMYTIEAYRRVLRHSKKKPNKYIIYSVCMYMKGYLFELVRFRKEQLTVENIHSYTYKNKNEDGSRKLHLIDELKKYLRTDNDRRVFDYIKENGIHKAKDMAEHLGITVSSVQTAILRMRVWAVQIMKHRSHNVIDSDYMFHSR